VLSKKQGPGPVLPEVTDDLDATVWAIQTAFEGDISVILCSGGVSVGRHDHVKEAAQGAEFRQIFWKVRQKPGKPLFATRKENTLLLGLPGNPVSAYICFVHYVRPLIKGLSGQPMKPSSMTAISRQWIVKRGKQTNFMRVRIENPASVWPHLHPLKNQGSHGI